MTLNLKSHIVISASIINICISNTLKKKRKSHCHFDLWCVPLKYVRVCVCVYLFLHSLGKDGQQDKVFPSSHHQGWHHELEYIQIRTHMDTHTHTHTHTHTQTHTHIVTRTHKHGHRHTHMDTQTHTHIHGHTHTHTHTHTQRRTQTQTHTYI